MTAPVAQWPGSLPDRSSIQTTETAPNLRIEQEMDLGPPKTRRVASTGVRHIEVTYEMTGAQVAELDDFYLTTLQSGTLPFMGIHPRTGQQVKAMMTEPEYQPRGGDEWYASFVLQVLAA